MGAEESQFNPYPNNQGFPPNNQNQNFNPYPNYNPNFNQQNFQPYFTPRPYVRPINQYRPNQLAGNDYNFLSQNSGLSHEQINEIFVNFTQNNPDGNMNRQEFVDLYFKLSPNEPFSNVNIIAGYVFDLFDRDHNNSISFYDFLVSYSLIGSSHIQSDPYQKLNYVFDLYDTNKNGQLDETEMYWLLYGTLRLTGGSNQYGNLPYMVYQIISEIDRDRSGSVSKNEFLQAAMSNPFLRSVLEKPTFR